MPPSIASVILREMFMPALDSVRLDDAERFLWLNARLIDRLRAACLFRDAPAAAVVAALLAYQNADGGFGHALEPDLRGPTSQPQPVEVALRILDEVGARDAALSRRVCDYLATITTAEGGVPFVLPSVRAHPRAPWWETDDDPPASLNPTAALAGLLHKAGVAHPWLARATDYCWQRLEKPDLRDGYALRCVFLFLAHVPDRARAEETLARVAEQMRKRKLVELDPAATGHMHTPLDMAPAPAAMARRLFSDAEIAGHLDALAAGQQEDGGWQVGWPAWTPAAGLEWRGWATVRALAILRAYERLPTVAPRAGAAR
jgi:hypothetical protein